MITNEQIKKAIEDCAKANHTISVRDISYVLLAMQFDDSLVAYKCLFGNDYDYNQEYHNTYDNTATMNYLKTYIEFTLLTDKKKKKTSEDISFEENKAYMLKLKKETEDAMNNGEIDKKDGLKILSDISVKLNDRFSVKEDQQDRVVSVQSKFSSVCSYCGHECAPMPISKEAAMEMYDLVEKE